MFLSMNKLAGVRIAAGARPGNEQPKKIDI